ncbi:mannitol-1-phosphate 5-dehydrogenase [Clostridia bacterium]|nr:mannitol-1-phosphate 5-dehydrogenase [Clostridia bacterium]
MKTAKKAVMYGAGNIGRGFIGQLFSESGYEVAFIDINEKVIDALNRDREYPVVIVRPDGIEELSVKRVRGVLGTTPEIVAAEMKDCDIMATALGVNVLKYVAKNLAAGIKQRIDAKKPIDIIICENLLDADKYLKGLILKELPESYAAVFDRYVGLVEASIGRMVPVMDENMQAGNILRVYVEEYGYLPVDKAAFKNPIPKIKNLYPYAPFGLFIQRKLFMHNMSHALTAYLGALKGYAYIADAIGDAGIENIVYAALVRSAQGLSIKHGADINALLAHASNLIYRFKNKGLRDTVARVGRDTQRKLFENDRLTGALNLVKKHKIPSVCLCAGIAAALLFTGENDAASAEVCAHTRSAGVQSALEKYCRIDDRETVKTVEKIYADFASGKPLSEIGAYLLEVENKSATII